MTDTLNDPTRAFDDLRREVSLGLRAIQGLAAEHKEIPDYSDTLTAIDGRLASITQSIAVIAKSPAMQLTPESLVERSNSAIVSARRGDADLLRLAAQRMDGWAAHIKESLEQARNARNQRTRLLRTAAGCSVAGIFIGMFVAYLFVRSLPTEVQLPRPTASRAPAPNEPVAGATTGQGPSFGVTKKRYGPADRQIRSRQYR
jgi:hypothetical protein